MKEEIIQTTQGTLAGPVFFEGPGLHTGGNHRVAIRPAPVGHGIVFRQIDTRGRQTEIPADFRRVKALPLCTCLTAGGRSQVRTIEHLMAAFYACGVDNALVEVRGGEIPIKDGSAAPLIELIHNVGLQSQNERRRRILIRKTVEVSDEYRFLRIEPAPRLQLRIRTSARGFGRFLWRGPMNRSIFTREMAAARTSGKLIHGILARCATFAARDPLCQGAGLNSAIVIFGNRVLNKGGLRYPDEFVRHRILDLMGDLMLGGVEIIGRITARSPVHRLNHRLLEAVFSDSEAWEAG
jgi:UDP-3-O-[3-hydroxymyristoyl] N-acetylglucosamine deacetylase